MLIARQGPCYSAKLDEHKLTLNITAYDILELNRSILSNITEFCLYSLHIYVLNQRIGIGIVTFYRNGISIGIIKKFGIVPSLVHISMLIMRK